MKLSLASIWAALLIVSPSCETMAQPFEQLIGAAGPLTYERLSAVQQYVHRPSGTLLSTDVLLGGDVPPLVGQWFDPPDWMLVRAGADGSIVWQRRLIVGDGGYHGASAIAVLSEGSAVVCGGAEDGGPGPFDVGVARIDAAGSLVWATHVLGAPDASAVAALPGDGAVVVAGNLGTGAVTILNAAGGIVASKALAMPSPYDGYFTLTDVRYDAATGTIVICGWANHNVTFDVAGVVIRMSTAGVVLDARVIDQTNAFGDPIYFEVLAIEPVPGGVAIAVASEVWNHDDPEFVYTISAPVVVGLTNALGVYAAQQFSSFGQNLRPHQGALRYNADGTLGLLGQYSFGDGGSQIWLARFAAADCAYIDRHEYGAGGNAFPGGLCPAVDAPGGWLIAGSIQSLFSTSDGYHVHTRADATTGCEALPLDELPALQLVSAPVILIESPAAVAPIWTPTIVDTTFVRQSVCDPQPPCPCSVADITEVGGTVEAPGVPDCQLTLDDLLVFVNAFGEGAGCPGSPPCCIADVTDVGDTGAGPDGQLTLDDILAFVNAFGEGC